MDLSYSLLLPAFGLFQSCVGVVLDFISPENATQCVKLSDEIRLLPRRHKARERLLEVRFVMHRVLNIPSRFFYTENHEKWLLQVKRMTLHGINAAIEDIYNLMHLEQVILLCTFLILFLFAFVCVELDIYFYTETLACFLY